MIRATISMQGLAELKKRLEALKGADTAVPIRAALRGMGNHLKKEIIAAAPYDGKSPDDVHIRENVQVGRSRRASGPGREVVTVGIKYGKRTLKNGKEVKSEGAAFYWKFLEFGTSHQSASPFIRPTFEESRAQLTVTFEKEMAKSIKRLERKYGSTP